MQERKEKKQHGMLNISEENISIACIDFEVYENVHMK